MTVLGKIRRSLFSASSSQAVFEQPGFAPEAWPRFHSVVESLLEGYHATLEDSRFEVLVPRLDAIEPELQGFAYEGAGMGLAALDCLAPWKNRVQAFVEGPAAPHIYPTYVGVGLALARLRRKPEPFFLKRLDPVLGWVAIDGYGFHEGFFARRRTMEQKIVPSHLSSYARRLFDQGVGRAIWFSNAAIAGRVVTVINSFPQGRQSDLWSGVGLACAYAGGADAVTLEELCDLAKPYRFQLARGAAVAAQGRLQANNLAPHTELACQIFCSLSSAEAARIINVTREDLPTGGSEPAYEIWRQRAQARFSAQQEEGTYTL
ncbi:hypothetical protein KDH_07750 [Dictyobacter sp. S3.2.2.5]|uniref:DUF1702 family protein n=1 Tax=Dictyobacter halimunensis TaxID=3026934 RepID=A0ABQ6FMA4_9CHLR|nr:hypothetical protein KDH_07750 [Dictyobacter sp. S3.2.2.5]